MNDPDRAIDAAAVLGWARDALPAVYASLLEAMVEEAERDDQVSALLLTGSMARRDALPGTDIDVRHVLRSGADPSFRRDVRDGILLEETFTVEAAARAQVTANPMHVYAYLDGVALYDRDGALARLRSHAHEVFCDYKTPPGRKREIADALRHPEDKVRIGLAAGDLLKATFCLSTTSWQLIEGLWAANDLPVPPNSSVRPHLRDLRGPAEVEEKFARLFLGEPAERAETALSLLGWVRRQLAGPAASPR